MFEKCLVMQMCSVMYPFILSLVICFYFLITYEVCKKRKYCNRMSEQKNSLLLINVHVLYVLEDKTSKKNSVCLYVRTYVDFSCGHNNFRRNQRIQTKFGGCLLCLKCRSGIEIQSNIMILILILILCGATTNLVDIFTI